MIEAILKEIHLANKSIKDKPEIVPSIYFGGGTPSILSSADLKMIFSALRDHYVFADDIEITLEANPDDISSSKLAEWRSLGISRLSVGIQSFVEEELKWMNRVHSAAESLSCIDVIRKAGMDNFSVDLIYGSPVLNDEAWRRNVATVIEKNIPHISCYALTVEPRTALDKMITQHKKEPTDPDKQARQFLQLMEWMERAGYEHYEISNFSKPGFRGKHNSNYWSAGSYYGFGPAAHSFDGKKRRWNIANNALFIQSIGKEIIPFEEETLTDTQQLNEYIMISLRTMEGIDLGHIGRIFGDEKRSRVEAASAKFENTGKLKFENARIILSKEGKLFADGIAADLFF